MNDILNKLSKRNKFNYHKMPADKMNDFGNDLPLMQWLQDQNNTHAKPPFVLLQHHYFTDLWKSSHGGIPQPTFINVIRDPVDWFSSHYHFMFYGWNRDQGKRDNQAKLLEKHKPMPLEDCIKYNEDICTKNPWRYIEFFSGIDFSSLNIPMTQHIGKKKSYFMDFSEVAKKKIIEFTKHQILHEYFVVGVLEQFEDTLELFEFLMPKFYNGALDVWRSNTIQNTRNQTKSLNKNKLSDESMAKLRQLLYWEIDLYDFVRGLFNAKLSEKRKHDGFIDKFFG